jgi:hypothetical protein
MKKSELKTIIKEIILESRTIENIPYNTILSVTKKAVQGKLDRNTIDSANKLFRVDMVYDRPDLELDFYVGINHNHIATYSGRAAKGNYEIMDDEYGIINKNIVKALEELDYTVKVVSDELNEDNDNIFYDTPEKISQFEFAKRNPKYDYAESHAAIVTIYGEFEKNNKTYFLVNKGRGIGVSTFKGNKELAHFEGVVALSTLPQAKKYFLNLYNSIK